MIGAVF